MGAKGTTTKAGTAYSVTTFSETIRDDPTDPFEISLTVERDRYGIGGFVTLADAPRSLMGAATPRRFSLRLEHVDDVIEALTRLRSRAEHLT